MGLPQEAGLSLLSCAPMEAMLEADLQQEAHRLHSHLQASSTGVDQAVAPHLSHMLLLATLQQQIMEQCAPPEMHQGERLVLAISWVWPFFQAGKTSSAFGRLRPYLRDSVMLQVLLIKVCLRTSARHWLLRGRRHHWQHRPGRLQSWLQQTVFITGRPAALVHQGPH